jgi:hypothetical protein
MGTLADTLRDLDGAEKRAHDDPYARALGALSQAVRVAGDLPFTVADVHAVKTADYAALSARRAELVEKIASCDGSAVGKVRALADSVRVAGIDRAFDLREKRAAAVRALGALSLLKRVPR